MFNTQKTENATQTSPDASKGLSWKWEKRHTLLLITGVCLLLWWVAGQGKVSWVASISHWLPLIGGLALVGEQLVKLIS